MKQKSNTMRNVVAGVTGTILAGTAVAAAVIMSNKKNQEKVKNALGNATDSVKNKAAEVKKSFNRKGK